MSEETTLLFTGDVEAFLLYTCSDRPRSLTASAPAYQEKASLNYKLAEDPLLPSATITDLCNEPLFFSGYLSEEEDTSSSSEADDMSLSSVSVHDMHDDAESSDDAEATFPEALAEDCDYVEQRCNHAQAVIIVPAGRAKVVQVTKVTLPVTPALKRHASSADRSTYGRPDSRMSGMSLSRPLARGSGAGSYSSMNTTRPQTRVPSGSPNMPSTPVLEAGLQTPLSARTPLTPQTPRSGFFDSPGSPTSSDKSTTPTSSRPRVRNPYHLKLPHVTKRSVSENYKDSVDNSFSSPLSAPLSVPCYKPKMVARGGSERVSTLELPPFPAENSPKPSRPWALRKDSFGPILSREGSKTSRIRRVESGILLQK